MFISDWTSQSSKKLASVGIDSSLLDAQLLLAASLGESREYLIAHNDETIPDIQLQNVNKWLKRRLNHEPIAYILGHKEFYGRDFLVSQSVLIPRPESETIIDTLKQIQPEIIIDIGTGSGCLAISAKLEMPDSQVIAIDISDEALQIARLNARSFNVEITFANSDLLSGIKTIKGDKSITIIANLPYVDTSWETSPETSFEPKQALFAEDNGLELIKKLLLQAKKKLHQNDNLILEADPRQHKTMTQYAKKHGFSLQKVDGFIALYTLQA